MEETVRGNILSLMVMVPSKSVKKMIFGFVFMAGNSIEPIVAAGMSRAISRLLLWGTLQIGHSAFQIRNPLGKEDLVVDK